MIYKTLGIAFVAVVVTLCGSVSAQSGVAAVDYSLNNEIQPIGRRCGRSINQVQAASLWAGYCQEDCEYKGGDDCGGCNDCGSRTCGGGCKLGGKLRGRRNKNNDGCGCVVETTVDCGACDDVGCDAGGCGRSGKLRGMFAGFGSRSGGCGCDMGCFGYPTDCGCDCDDGGCGNECGGGCKMGGKLRGKFAGFGSCAGGCGCDVGCFGYPTDCGCGCDDGGGCKMGGKLRGRFNRSKKNCGCNGAYFDECVGAEYGTAGMQSSVSGCGTSSVMAQPIGASDAPMEVKSEGAANAVEALKDDAVGN